MTNTHRFDKNCCDYEVYSHGKVIGVFDMPKDEANQLVVKLSKKTGNRIDWHYVGGRVVMKMLPPKASVNSRKTESRNKREGWYAGKLSRCSGGGYTRCKKFKKLKHAFWYETLKATMESRKDE